MAKELQPLAVAATAQSQASCWTAQVWRSVRRRGPEATAEDLTAETVRAYRDQLERAGRTPATIAKHLSALTTGGT
jgi:hypothetical protein